MKRQRFLTTGAIVVAIAASLAAVATVYYLYRVTMERHAAALRNLAISGGARPALILMDCQMPVMDGFEATMRIRQWEAANGQPRLSIVALTADAYDEDRQHCLAVGMDDFLTKPLSVAELSAALGQWMGGPATPPGKSLESATARSA